MTFKGVNCAGMTKKAGERWLPIAGNRCRAGGNEPGAVVVQSRGGLHGFLSYPLSIAPGIIACLTTQMTAEKVH